MRSGVNERWTRIRATGRLAANETRCVPAQPKNPFPLGRYLWGRKGRAQILTDRESRGRCSQLRRHASPREPP